MLIRTLFVVALAFSCCSCSVLVINLTDHATLIKYIPAISNTTCVSNSGCASMPPPNGTSEHDAAQCGDPRCFDPSALAYTIQTTALPHNSTGISVISSGGPRYCIYELAVEDPSVLGLVLFDANPYAVGMRHSPAFLAAFSCVIDGHECTRGLCGKRSGGGGGTELAPAPYGCHAAVDDVLLRRLVLSPSSTRAWAGQHPPTPFPHQWAGERFVYDALLFLRDVDVVVAGHYATYASYSYRGDQGFAPPGTNCTLGAFALRSPSCNLPTCNAAGFCGSRRSDDTLSCPVVQVHGIPPSASSECFDPALVVCTEARTAYGGFLAPENADLGEELRRGTSNPPPLVPGGILPVYLGSDPHAPPVYFIQPGGGAPYTLIRDPWFDIESVPGRLLVAAPLSCGLIAQSAVYAGGTPCSPPPGALPPAVAGDTCASATGGFCYSHVDLGPSGTPYRTPDGPIGLRAIPGAPDLVVGECRRRLAPPGTPCPSPIAESLVHASLLNVSAKCTYAACTGTGVCALHAYPAATPCASSQCSRSVCGVDGACDDTENTPASPVYPCDDRDPCTGGDACDGAGGCAGVPVFAGCLPCSSDSDCECTGGGTEIDSLRRCGSAGHCLLPAYNGTLGVYSGTAPILQPWQGLGEPAASVLATPSGSLGGAPVAVPRSCSGAGPGPCVRRSTALGGGFCGQGGACLPYLPLRRYAYLPILEEKLVNATATLELGDPVVLPGAVPCSNLTAFAFAAASVNSSSNASDPLLLLSAWNASVASHCVLLRRNVTRDPTDATTYGFCTQQNENCTVLTYLDPGFSPVPGILPAVALSAYYYAAGTVCAPAEGCVGARICSAPEDDPYGDCQSSSATNLTGVPCDHGGDRCVTGGRCSSGGTCEGGEETVCPQAGVCAGLSTCDSRTGVCSVGGSPAPYGTPCPSPCYPTDGSQSPPGSYCGGTGVCVAVAVAGSPHAVCNSESTQCTTSRCAERLVLLDPSSTAWMVNASTRDRDALRSVPFEGGAACLVAVRTRLGTGALLPRLCSDGNACTLGDVCSGGDDGGCIHTGGEVSCQNATVCTSVDPCNPDTGRCAERPLAPGTPCAAATPCTLEGVCNGTTDCLVAPVACDYLLSSLLSSNATSVECIDAVASCNASDGSCFLRGTGGGVSRPCFDGDGCTVGDRCDPLSPGVCLGGGTRACLTPPDQCHAAVGTCVTRSGSNSSNDGAFECLYPVAVGAACVDEDTCTRESYCSENGTCVGVPPPTAPPSSDAWTRGGECRVVYAAHCTGPPVVFLSDTLPGGEARRCACDAYPGDAPSAGDFDAAGCIGFCWSGECYLEESPCLAPRVKDGAAAPFTAPLCICPSGTVEPNCDIAPTPSWVETAVCYIVLFVLLLAAVTVLLVLVCALGLSAILACMSCTGAAASLLARSICPRRHRLAPRRVKVEIGDEDNEWGVKTGERDFSVVQSSRRGAIGSRAGSVPLLRVTSHVPDWSDGSQ